MTLPIVPPRRPWSRRDFLRQSFLTAGALGAAPWLLSRPSHLLASPRSLTSGGPIAAAGPLGEPDGLGVRLPEGFSYRVVAVSGDAAVRGGAYRWHTFPDAGATFATPDGGWIYVCNSEFPAVGGSGALRFGPEGRLRDSYPVLTGTSLNCGGGPTPWSTWLSCEEYTRGRVWECSPFGGLHRVRSLPALGIFQHEAVCVDAPHKMLYLTEDQGDGRFYRFVCSESDWPEGSQRPALRDGTLQVMNVSGAGSSVYPPDVVDVSSPVMVEWVDVVEPGQPQSIVREALGNAAPGSIFKGGEGIWYFEGLVYFATKGDDRIWVYDPAYQTLEAIYHFGSASEPNNILTGVDNLTVSAFGDVLVAEDGGNMELCAILPDRSVKAIFQIVGQDDSELTGPAFTPDGKRYYVNSQRGGRFGLGRGITYEVSLPQ